MSSAEAEYIALSHATQEVIWLRSLLSDIRFTQLKAMIMFEDNQRTISFVWYPKFNSGTKHINTKYHYIPEAVENKKIQLEHCCTR